MGSALPAPKLWAGHTSINGEEVTRAGSHKGRASSLLAWWRCIGSCSQSWAPLHEVSWGNWRLTQLGRETRGVWIHIIRVEVGNTRNILNEFGWNPITSVGPGFHTLCIRDFQGNNSDLWGLILPPLSPVWHLCDPHVFQWSYSRYTLVQVRCRSKTLKLSIQMFWYLSVWNLQTLWRSPTTNSEWFCHTS